MHLDNVQVCSWCFCIAWDASLNCVITSTGCENCLGINTIPILTGTKSHNNFCTVGTLVQDTYLNCYSIWVTSFIYKSAALFGKTKFIMLTEIGNDYRYFLFSLQLICHHIPVSHFEFWISNLWGLGVCSYWVNAHEFICIYCTGSDIMVILVYLLCCYY